MKPLAALLVTAGTAGLLDARASPEIAVQGSGRSARACAECHLSNGFGRPESASIAGLPSEYIEQQIADYRRGVRRNVDAQQGPAAAMIAVALAASDADVRAASAYFSKVAYAQWVQVVETDGATEIVERPAASGFVAYVPLGSVQRGEALVTTGGGGRTVRCALCHGEALKGAGSVPGIAGRSPTYLARQLRDMQRDARRGLGADFMKGTVARLTPQDITAIAAYSASRSP